MEPPDAQLIEEYSRGSHDALAKLIRRHVDLVYAAALRLTTDPGLADDVTQAVFILLARKTGSLRANATIAGWLVVTTRQVARTAIRGHARRRRHERVAARSEATHMTQDPAEAGELWRILDDALARLRSVDRDAIVLRYLQALSLAEVGLALGISEEAARKRVARGIHRLQIFFKRRGIAVGSAGLTANFQTLAAPPAPSAVITAVTSSTPSPQAISLSKGTIRMLRTRQVALICLIVSLVAVVALSVLAQSNDKTPNAPPPAAVPPRPAAGAAVIDIKSLAIQLAVTDVNQNIAFFDKIGFHQVWADKADADGQLPRASVRSGNVSVRLYRVANPPHPGKEVTAYFWIDAGVPALNHLRDAIASRGVEVGPIGISGVTLRQFDVITPDGYTLGFYAQP